MAAKYRGFNTIDQYKKFRVVDIELVKRDLINHFNIRKGEKLMNPEFGSIVWSLIFEPLDEETKALLKADVQQVVNYDPRVRADSVVLSEFDYGLLIEVDMTFLPTNESTTLSLKFDRESQTLFGS